jgi:hypothetical protein
MDLAWVAVGGELESVHTKRCVDRGIEMAMATQGQFDGEFADVIARDLRPNDVILGGARSVIATATANGCVAVETVSGAEIFDADATVYVFRPAGECVNEECPGCYARPGEPCDVMCLSYAALDDAAGTA